MAKASGQPPGIVPHHHAALADELVAAEAARAQRGNGVEGGQHLVAQIADVDVAALQVLPGRQEVGALVEGGGHGRFEVDGGRPDLHHVNRVNRRSPHRVVGFADDEALEHQLRGATGGLGLGQRLPPRGRLGLGRDDVHGGQRADFDADPVVLDELLGQRERLLGGLDRADRGEQVPVGVLGRRGGIRDAGPQRDVGDLARDRARQQLIARGVDFEVSEKAAARARR